MPPVHTQTKTSRGASTEEVVVKEHLAELRGRVRVLTWVSGVCWAVIVSFGGLLVTGTLDWLVHFDDSGTRLLIGLALLAGSGWMIWRQLIAPLRLPLSGTFLATRVERRFPGLKNRLLSAIEFLEHRLDPKLGSTELQKAVVKHALKDLERIEPSDVVETTAIRNVSIAGALVLAIAIIVTLLHPLEAATSIRRIVLPFATVPWPRAVELRLVRADLSPVILEQDQPILIARGETLELYVQNVRGRLPDHVWFETRTGDEGSINREPLRQTTLRNEKGRSYEAAIINWIAVRGTMQFRASGGDDRVMPFYRVEVVPPPNIDSLQVTLTPPSYSQRPVEVLPVGVGHVQGLLGTKIELSAECDKPLKSAKLRIGDRPGVVLKVDEDGRRFTASFEIEDGLASNYWFELTDLQGFTDREAVRYELRGIVDGIPEVNIEIPVADVLLTTDAELPVKILAKDDLGLRDIRISYQIGDEELSRAVPLFEAEKIDVDNTPEDRDSTNASTRLGPQRHESDYLWKMADLHLEPGVRIVFRAEATDDCNLGQPHVGKSASRTITIVSRDDKQKELAARVGDLLDDLRQATQLQQRAKQLTKELQTQLDKVGELRPQDLDQLRRADLDQRQTAARLSNPADGVETQARQLLAELRANHLNDSGTEQRLDRLTNELGRLEREELPDAERALTQAQKFAEGDAISRDKTADEPVNGTKSHQAPSQHKPSAKSDNAPDSLNGKARDKEADPSNELPPSEDETQPNEPGGDSTSLKKSEESREETPSGDRKNRDTANGKQPKRAPTIDEKSLELALSEAQAKQTQSLETLQDLQDSLSEWRDHREVNRDLASVIEEQQSIQNDASALAQRTMTKSSAELTKQEKAELSKLADRQKKTASRLDQFRKQLEQTADSIRKNDPDAADRLNDASHQLDKQSITSRMQDASDQIAENKMGEASAAQQKALDELHDVEQMMKRQPNGDTEQFVKQAQESQDEIHQLRQDQQDLADHADEIAKQPDSPEKQEQMRDLMQKQEEVAERMAKAERKLERLNLRGAAEAAHRARKRLDKMMEQMRDADDGEDVQQAMEDALDDLEQVEREIVLEKRIAQERLAFEKLEKIEDELKALRARQETVIAETIRLEDSKGEREGLSRGQLRTLKELAETERSLQHAAKQMEHQMGAAEVFSLVLKRLGRSLGIAADNLGERETSAATQSFENDAIRRIDSLLAVLKQEKKKQENSPKPPPKPEELSQEPQEQEEKPEEAQPPGETIPQLAQLKLLKSLQEEYLERTELLERFRDKTGKLPEAMELERNELAREQVELADLASNLIAKYLQQQPERKDAEDPKPESPKGPKEGDPTKIDL